jgi:phage terminase large subunit
LSVTLTLPHNFRPRAYQLPILKALDSGVKRAVWIVHRRGGKDKTAFNYTIKRAAQKVGVYFYFLPTYTQAKKVIWDGIDKDGTRFLDHIPKALIKNLNETEMKIELVNGSIIQLIGADNIDRIVGTNPIGCVFSEYSLMKPEVWEYIRPILAENGGWAVFIYTPRGMNHGWKLLQQAKSEPGWFSEVLTVEQTHAIPERGSNYLIWRRGPVYRRGH